MGILGHALYSPDIGSNPHNAWFLELFKRSLSERRGRNTFSAPLDVAQTTPHTSNKYIIKMIEICLLVLGILLGFSPL